MAATACAKVSFTPGTICATAGQLLFASSAIAVRHEPGHDADPTVMLAISTAHAADALCSRGSSSVRHADPHTACAILDAVVARATVASTSGTVRLAVVKQLEFSCTFISSRHVLGHDTEPTVVMLLSAEMHTGADRCSQGTSLLTHAESHTA